MVKLKVVKGGKPPVEGDMAKKIIRDDFLEANHALLQVHSLTEIAQEAFTDPERGNVYNLLGVIDEKVGVALDFFSKNDLCWEREV